MMISEITRLWVDPELKELVGGPQDALLVVGAQHDVAAVTHHANVLKHLLSDP